MAPVTRSREGKKESSPTVAGKRKRKGKGVGGVKKKETVRLPVAGKRKAAGGVKKKETVRLPVAGKRKGAGGVKKKETIGQAVRGQTSTNETDYILVDGVAIPVVYTDLDEFVNAHTIDDDYCPSPITYPDREPFLKKLSAMKKEAECKKKFGSLNTFVKKKTGKTYDEAIDQLVTGVLDPTSKTAKVIIPEICVYLSWRFEISRWVLRELYFWVEEWDKDVVSLVVDLVGNLMKIRPIFPGLDTVFSDGNSILEKGQPSKAHLKELVRELTLDMLGSDARLKHWSKSPTSDKITSDYIPGSVLPDHGGKVPLSYFQ